MLNKKTEIALLKSAIKMLEKKCIRITADPDRKAQPWMSRFGGGAYLPPTTPHPLNERGEPLHLLAQINFSEIPQLTPLLKEGLVQFYIDSGEGDFGINYENPTQQVNFRVVYFEEFNKEEFVLYQNNIDESPLTDPLFPTTLSFAPDLSLPRGVVGQLFFEEEWLLAFTQLKDKVKHYQEKLDKLLCDLTYNLNNPNSYIGGYPDFIQGDPRSKESHSEHTFLLLQIGSDEITTMWHDLGTAQFFINPKQLLAKDFSNVLYAWAGY